MFETGPRILTSSREHNLPQSSAVPKPPTNVQTDASVANVVKVSWDAPVNGTVVRAMVRRR